MADIYLFLGQKLRSQLPLGLICSHYETLGSIKNVVKYLKHKKKLPNKGRGNGMNWEVGIDIYSTGVCVCVCLCVCVSVRVHVCVCTQLYPTLCNIINCSLPVFSVHGIFQARIMVWVAISYSRGSSQPKDQTHLSCIAGRFFTI